MEAKIKTTLIYADAHYPIHDKNVLEIVKQIGKDKKPDYLVFLGDMFDADGISKFTPKDWLTGAYETLEEIHKFREDVFLPLWKACGQPPVKYCLGNHEHRLTDWLETLRVKKGERAYKDWKDKFNLEKIFVEADIKPYNTCHKIGKLNFTHGEFHNNSHSKKHATVYGQNIYYGHLHTLDISTVPTKADNKIHKATSIPCGQKFNPKWMKNKSSAWVNGLSFIYFFPNGNYHDYPITIINKKTIFENKVYAV